MAKHSATAPVAHAPPGDEEDLALLNRSKTLPIPLTSEPQPMQNRSNIVLFGEMGAGKSSVVNLIMGQVVAKTSSSASSCTLDAKAYEVTIQGRDFRIFDTVGLNEPEKLRDSDCLIGAIFKAYRLVSYLSETGGISLLLFCIQKGRITVSMEQNYLLFHDFLCHKRVPVALVVTHLEHEESMENWWPDNHSHFADCGIHTVGQACITSNPVFHERYYASRQVVHDLLVAHGCGSGFTYERVSWLTGLFQKLLDLAGVHPRWDSIKARARKFREYGLKENEIATLLTKISAVDEDLELLRPRSHVFPLLARSHKTAPARLFD